MTDSTADDEIPTAPAVASDTTLINLNVAIEAALREYLPSDVAIRFDLPPKDSTPDVPTVCIFLYDIQEDLQLRVGEGRKFNSTTGVEPLEWNALNRYRITISHWRKPGSDFFPWKGQMRKWVMRIRR